MNFLAALEQGFMALLSAAIALGVFNDPLIVPSKYAHYVQVAVGVLIFAAYKRHAPLLTKAQLDEEVKNAQESGTIKF